jgi:glycosyltransferase involved in cell wall biosynthesis
MKGDVKVWIIVDNLRIGGIERLALDQMYFMSDSKIRSKLFVLDKQSTITAGNFLNVESDFIENKRVNFEYCPTNFLHLIIFFIRQLLTHNPTLILDYTLKATPVLRLLKIVLLSPVRIHCVIQQLASLSAPIQRYKRMLYAQFSTGLFINSIYYSRDWDNYRSKNLVSRLFFSKPHSIIRNGIYLDRLDSRFLDRPVTYQSSTTETPRFIFLGRLKTWKGLDKLYLLDRVSNQNCRFLIFSPDNDELVVNKFRQSFGERVEFVIGKSPQYLTPEPNDVHVYGVDYGQGFNFPESVSTNCLEMAYLNIPSMVTAGGAANWPELKDGNLIYEVNWENEKSVIEVISKIYLSGSNRSVPIEFREAVSVERNINEHLALLNKKYQRCGFGSRLSLTF